MQSKDIINFWFKESTPKQWFTKDPVFDEQISSRFLDIYHKAAAGETKDWRVTPEGRLAEIIVLDQFPRNMFRDTPQAFATDAQALELAKEAIQVGAHKELGAWQRQFLFLPYMHSESRAVHKKAIWLFVHLPVSRWWSWISYEYKHKRIIDRFGRYPHRNEALGRESTSDEIEFLKNNPGF